MSSLNRVSKRKLPGTAIYMGNSTLETQVKHYKFRNFQLHMFNEITDFSSDKVDWIAVEGLKDEQKVRSVCEKLGIQPLTIEDILNVNQRNKVEETADYLFFVFKYINPSSTSFSFDYISVVVTKKFICTFNDFLNPLSKEIISRVKNEDSQLSKRREDYLLYLIYDMIVDDQIEVLRNQEDLLANYEAVVLEKDNKFGSKIYNLHKEIVLLRNNFKTLKTNVNPKTLVESKLISGELIDYFTDLDDHLDNSLEKSSSIIEVCKSLISLYSNELNSKTNSIMKTLTIISVIFIPLSFLTGLFGMNFRNFPVLEDPNGLLYFGLISLGVTLLLLFFFRRRTWL